MGLIFFLRALLVAVPEIDLHSHCDHRQGSENMKSSEVAAKFAADLYSDLVAYGTAIQRSGSTKGIIMGIIDHKTSIALSGYNANWDQ